MFQNCKGPNFILLRVTLKGCCNNEEREGESEKEKKHFARKATSTLLLVIVSALVFVRIFMLHVHVSVFYMSECICKRLTVATFILNIQKYYKRQLYVRILASQCEWVTTYCMNSQSLSASLAAFQFLANCPADVC